MGLRPTQDDEKRLGPATTLYGTVALSFVIPSEAEGPAVPRTFRGNVFRKSAARLQKNLLPLSTRPQNRTTVHISNRHMGRGLLALLAPLAHFLEAT
jgi:hypothetical protein